MFFAYIVFVAIVVVFLLDMVEIHLSNASKYPATIVAIIFYYVPLAFLDEKKEILIPISEERRVTRISLFEHGPH